MLMFYYLENKNGGHLLVYWKIVEVHVAGYIVVYPSGIPAYAIFLLDR